ncbi:hypothetical protein ADUPG1_011586 [Aduncisulcus paluster]|uniref:Transcription factor TFIIIC triple barrel domain-containing protein n=1 Tax=Aduncisulcus paluster TaxID=2918883 RepID=A0ABQ5JX40_9EUKA|nr:hypothetical protein ADUPG1_011586 [Aduncisulcus paluster]
MGITDIGQIEDIARFLELSGDLKFLIYPFHVENKEMESTLEDEYDVEYVSMDIPLAPDEKWIDSVDNIEMVGIDADYPLVQIGHRIFQVRKNVAIGSHLYFTAKPSSSESSSIPKDNELKVSQEEVSLDDEDDSEKEEEESEHRGKVSEDTEIIEKQPEKSGELATDKPAYKVFTCIPVELVAGEKKIHGVLPSRSDLYDGQKLKKQKLPPEKRIFFQDDEEDSFDDEF